jgi:hypothetical protein
MKMVLTGGNFVNGMQQQTDQLTSEKGIFGLSVLTP